MLAKVPSKYLDANPVVTPAAKTTELDFGGAKGAPASISSGLQSTFAWSADSFLNAPTMPFPSFYPSFSAGAAGSWANPYANPWPSLTTPTYSPETMGLLLPPATTTASTVSADSIPISSTPPIRTTKTGPKLKKASTSPPKSSPKPSNCECRNCKEANDWASRFPGALRPPVNTHTCDVPGCNKLYGKTSHLKAHMRWHTPKMNYFCEITGCGKCFMRLDEKQEHERQKHAPISGLEPPRKKPKTLAKSGPTPAVP